MSEALASDRFVRSSPFVDGYHIERTPVATMSDEPFDEAREQERFERLVTCVDISRHEHDQRREWFFSDAPFTSVPPPETARWWLERLDVENPEVAPLPADVLAPLVAGSDGIDAALTEPNLRFGDHLARRALLPLASSQLRAEWRALAAQPLPEEITVEPQYVRWLSEVTSVLHPDFVRSAVVRGPDEDVSGRVREFLAEGFPLGHGDRLGYDAAMTVLLLPEAEREPAWPSSWRSPSLYDIPFPPDVSPLAAAAPGIFYERTIRAGGTLAESFVAINRALPLRTEPAAAAAWIRGLRELGTSPALEWLHGHPQEVLAAEVPAEKFVDLYLVLAEFDTATLTAARDDAPEVVGNVVAEILAERALERTDDPGPWWHVVPPVRKRRKKLDALRLDLLPPLLQDGRALAPALVDQLVQGLATGDLTDELLAEVRNHLDPASCDEFAVCLLVQWLHRDAPAKDSWMLTSTAAFAGQAYVNALITYCQWCHWGSPTRGLKAIHTLGRTDSDAALEYLLEVASNGPSSSARRREATGQLAGIAQRRGMSVNRLEDRMLVDVSKPPVKRQKARFLQAMVAGENWPFEDFTTYVVGHPALKELTAGLVWGVYSGPQPEAGLCRSFIVDEEGRALDVEDAVVEIAAQDNIRVVHPTQLSDDEREAWVQVLADDELVPPFDQLSRPVFTLTEAEAEATALSVVPTKEIAPKRLNGILIKHGWDRGRAGSGGYISVMTLPVASAGCTVVMVVSEPGLHAVPSTDSTKLVVTEVFATDTVVPMGTLSTERDEVHALPRRPWSIVPGTVVSEVLATLSAR